MAAGRVGRGLLAGLTTSAALAALALGAVSPRPGLAQSRSLRDGVYTEEQAERGERLFEEACAECHPTQEFPPPGYFESWEGATVEVLYELVRTTMPESNPASLSRAEYADVFAFLFSRNGWPAGEAELGSDAEFLATILIESPEE